MNQVNETDYAFNVFRDGHITADQFIRVLSHMCNLRIESLCETNIFEKIRQEICCKLQQPR